jgi:hypothetical protein
MSLSGRKESRGTGARHHVTIAADQVEVFEAIRDKAKTGNPQAVREYREWLTRLHLVQAGGDTDVLTKPLADMTPDELAFADAWAERQIARAQRRAAALRARQAG